MPGPKPLPIELTERQTLFLETLVRRTKTEQRLAKRANIILLAAQGMRNAQIARQLGVGGDAVWIWRKRWYQACSGLTSIEESLAQTTDKSEKKAKEKEYQAALSDFLNDRKRSGKPPEFTAQQIVQLVALACKKPEDYGRPISHWTPRELRDESISQGIFESISERSVRRFLKRSRLKTPSKPLLVKLS